ncbi:MAG: FAD-binding oxidoreductase [Candidatus Omnitrophica bacterium]|nr:FAD-binding oxidoreductase [Candidatus Omnitrophota bacterium]
MLRNNDKNTFINYLEDNSGLKRGDAEEIVFPQTEEEAIEFLKESAGNKSMVTISGAGTGVVGGRIPRVGKILATDRLNRIIEIQRNQDDSGGWAVVEPGVSVQRLNDEAMRLGLIYRPDPTEKNAFIGGTVATNASGAQGFKYGATRNYILGVNVIFAKGQKMSFKRGEVILDNAVSINFKDGSRIKCPVPQRQYIQIKNTAGYFIYKGSDLVDLFIGQEGTLGLISRITVKLADLPRKSFSGLVFFDTDKQALELVQMLKMRSYLSRKEQSKDDIDCACIEYFDLNCLRMLKEKYSLIPQKKNAAIFFEQNMETENEAKVMGFYEQLMENLKIRDEFIWIGSSMREKEQITAMRYDLPVIINEKVKKNKVCKISTDCAVSDDEFPRLFWFYKQKLKESEIPFCIFGHIGENHLHVNLMPEGQDDFLKASRKYKEFIVTAVKMGGTVSAEHGIGKLKREYLKIMLKDTALRQMAAIKMAFDPQLMLGMGNIFEEQIFKKL